MKKNNGVSMIELVIVIIILVLIAGFSVFSGRQSIEKAEAMEIYVEMNNIIKAVNGVMTQRELEGGDDNWIIANGYCESGDSGDKGWFEIYGMDNPKYEESTLRNNLNMDVIRRSYDVNYDTGEVILHEAVELYGNKIRTYESLKALVESDKI